MKFKEIYFQDSIIEPNILYKKITFSNQELFLNLNQYSMKRVEYKLRSFCQIAEELGAQLIDIKYNYIKNMKNDINIGLKTNAINIGGKVSENKDNKDEINLKFEYPSNHIHINLNKYSLINKIIRENQFLLSKEEFESDVELKYLIDARCTSFIQKYNTQFTVESCNFIEKKLYLEAQKYGINFDSTFLNNHSINLSIYVEFFPLIENPHIIDGTNLHVLREGFLFLMRIIDIELNILVEKKLDKEEELIEKRKIYRKLIQYLKTHIYAIENNWIDLNFSYYFQDNVTKILKQMIEKNFKQEEFEDYIIKYFENHMGWSGFLNLRNIILKGDLSGLDKLSFISTQYMDILIYKKTIIDNINKYIEDKLKNQIFDFLSIKNEDRYFMQKIVIEKTKNDLFKKIQNLIIQVFRKSFYIYNGLSNNQDYESLKDKMYTLLIYNFDNQVFDIHKELEEESKNYKFKNDINYVNLKSKISIWIDKVLKYLNTNNYFVKEEISPIKNINLPNVELGLTIINTPNNNNETPSNNYSNKNNNNIKFVIEEVDSLVDENDNSEEEAQSLESKNSDTSNEEVQSLKSDESKSDKSYDSEDSNEIDNSEEYNSNESDKNKKDNNKKKNNISNMNYKNSIIICTSLIDRQRKYFVKYIIRYYQYNHQMDILSNFCNIETENNDDIEFNLYNYINDYFSLNKLYSNYVSYRLFFSYDDFENIINKIKNEKNIQKNNNIMEDTSIIKKTSNEKNYKKKIKKEKLLKKKKNIKNNNDIESSIHEELNVKDIFNKEKKNDNKDKESDNENDYKDNAILNQFLDKEKIIEENSILIEENRLNQSILYIFKYIFLLINKIKNPLNK